MLGRPQLTGLFCIFKIITINSSSSLMVIIIRVLEPMPAVLG